MSSSLSANGVYIVDAVRTPIGKFLGQFKKLEGHDLGAAVLKSLLERNQTIQPKEVNSIHFGQVLVAGQRQNPVRRASVNAGIPNTVPAYGISMVCGSGLRAVQIARNEIASGDAKITIAGGQESMSRAKHAAYLRDGARYGDMKLEDSMFIDGLTDAFEGYTMGVTAENIASKHDISRESQDKAAIESHARAVMAQQEGWFKEEICTVGECENDEQPRIQDEARLARQKPYWKPEGGSVTPGNASTLNDGAAALLLCSGDIVAEKKLAPMGRILGQSMVAIDPAYMGLAPISAVKQLLQKLSWSVNDVDLFELNEAFAVQALACCQQLEIPSEKVNVQGGAIALGHPIGCSGARILVTLMHSLKRLKKRYGIASLCIGGGQSVAIAVENLHME